VAPQEDPSLSQFVFSLHENKQAQVEGTMEQNEWERWFGKRSVRPPMMEPAVPAKKLKTETEDAGPADESELFRQFCFCTDKCKRDLLLR